MRLNYYYSDSIKDFLQKDDAAIIGEIAQNGRLGHISTELFAWENQISILKESLSEYSGKLFFEFSIPRMGKRVDCLLIVKNIVFVIEFKVGEKDFLRSNIEQVWDYALDLKNFHKPSHNLILVPVLVATQAKSNSFQIITTSHQDNLINPLLTNADNLKTTIQNVLEFFESTHNIDATEYILGSYSPTPTIIEAAVKLYNSHNVEEITRSDADATNLVTTTKFIAETIDFAIANHKKIICFVTGVPGAGKTLVGLKVGTEHLDKEKGNTSVFLSVSMHSFRAEHLSKFVKQLLDLDAGAANTYQQFQEKYPLVITRKVEKAKAWLREKARGSERYGIVISSQAYRLKPLAIDVRTPINHVNWFLDGKDDI